MREKIALSLERFKKNGSLAIAALLLTELAAVLWLGFLGLFALETLLPTFVTVRLSLTEYLTWLVLGTAALLFLRDKAGVTAFEVPPSIAGPLFWTAILALALLVALSMARFPVIPGIIFFVGYSFLAWLLWRSFQESN